MAKSAAEDAWQLNVNFRTGGERNAVEENVQGHESLQGKKFLRDNSRFTIAGSAEGKHMMKRHEHLTVNGATIRRIVRGSVGPEEV